MQSLWFRQSLSLWERWICEAKTERASPLKVAAAVSLHDPSREKAILENPQIFQNCEIINILSAIYAQSNAARILNRPALGGVHHKIRAFGDAILRKIALFQRHPPGGKIRVTGALPCL